MDRLDQIFEEMKSYSANASVVGVEVSQLINRDITLATVWEDIESIIDEADSENDSEEKENFAFWLIAELEGKMDKEAFTYRLKEYIDLVILDYEKPPPTTP